MKIRNKAIATTLIGASLLTNMMPVFANENPTTCIDIKKPVLISEEKLVPVLFNSAADKNVNVNIDGKIVTFPDQKPILIKAESRTIVPVRFITEHLGGTASWDEDTKTAMIELDGKKVELPVNKKYAKVDGEQVELDSSAKLISNRTFVPLRFVCETFGYDVSWDDATDTVKLNKKDDNVYAGGSKYFDETLGLYKMFGNVTNIENDTILVEGEGLYNQVRFNINEDTEIVDLDGMKLSKDDIKDANEIVVYHDQKMTRSLPPIANAQKIVVAKFNLKDGKISQITDVKNGKMFLVGSMNDGINFNVSDETVIVNEFGQKLNIDALTKGSDVEVYYGNIMTMSLPPITSAKKVVVKNVNVKEGSISQITEVKNGKMILVGSLEDGINFNITDETEIVSENGQNLSVDDLIKGAKVEVCYGNMMTASLPPITNATKVVVKGVYAMTGEVKTVQENSILVEGKGLYDQIVFNITDETKIVDKEGKALSKADIKEGSKVVAYHGGAMTRSLPPITNATKIIVE